MTVKKRSKREIYRILVMKGGLYLSPEFQASSEYINDIMVGKKRQANRTLKSLGLETERCYNGLCSSGEGTVSDSDFGRSKEAR